MVWLQTHSPWVYLTQSLWRDEAFAYLLATKDLGTIIKLSALDFNPPLHYILLHFWIGIFGTSEVALRLFSFVFYILWLLVMNRLLTLFFPKKWVMIFTLLVALNPMILYYAFEVRMYSMFAFFSTLSTFALYRKKWFFFVAASVAGLYTHSYMPFTLFSHAVYMLFLFWRGKERETMRSYLASLCIIVLAYLPWIPIIISQWARSKESWIYPVDLQLFLSVLGNLQTGYEGTPGGFWWLAQILSAFIFIIIMLATTRRFRESLLFFIWLFLPLTIVLSVSIVKPLFVNRYMIFSSVAEMVLVGLGIYALKREKVQSVVLVFFFLLFISINMFRPATGGKLDIRSVYRKIALKMPPDTLILANPLVFFEGLYYFPDPSRVFVYYPSNNNIPSYIGTSVIEPRMIVKEIPVGRPVVLLSQNGEISFP